MMKIPRRLFVEVGVVSLVMMVLTSSYVARKESVVGKSEGEILQMAIEKNDYELAQRVYEGNVLGAMTDTNDIEMTIYPEKRIAAEIERLEALLAKYPTYPPLLTQLAKLKKEIGNIDAAEKYEEELARLNVKSY